jgi:sugar fermentation stimulation protein A
MASPLYIKAVFKKRINRFVSQVLINNKVEEIYVPNTGRLSELAIPGNEVILIPSPGKYRYRLLYIFHNNFPVMIDSARSNTLFPELLSNGLIPDLKNDSIIRSEPAYQNHRFDFLMENEGYEYFLELKSCTLAYKNIASFPDAVSARGAAHIELLASAGNGKLFILILHSGIKTFVPNFHTDFNFYETLRKYSGDVEILPYSVEYDSSFNIVKLNKVPLLIPKVKPSGIYYIVLWNDKDRVIECGSLGNLQFKKGYYIYSGSGKNNLFKRIGHHRKKKKKKHWHIDYITAGMKVSADIPIVTDEYKECDLADILDKNSGEPVKNFGSTDCKCFSHLHYFQDNPVEKSWFWQTVLRLRFERFLQ